MTSLDNSHAIHKLSFVLVQTFSALALGWLSVRAKWIDPGRGDMVAIRFYIGWIGLPLAVFNKLATASLGAIDWNVVFACNLSKLVAYIVTFVMTFVAYKSWRSVGQRLITSTNWAFFAVCSNDLAIGFPLTKALYGQYMEIYIAANVFIFQAFFQPMTLIALEVGQAWRDVDESNSSPRAIFHEVMCKASKSIVQNVVILATLAGVAYQHLFGIHGVIYPTVTTVDGVSALPHPICDIIELWTSPFTMMFLFLNGTALISPRLGFWSSLLALMKVVVCAYLTYAMVVFLVGSKTRQQTDLAHFAFFYGSIPTGAAPLVFSSQYDPANIGIVASASLFCLLLAAPVEVVTAVFLDVGVVVVNRATTLVQEDIALVSFSATTVLLFILVVTWQTSRKLSWFIGCYGTTVLLYDLVTLFLHGGASGNCDVTIGMRIFDFLQTACCLEVLVFQYLLVEEFSRQKMSCVWLCVGFFGFATVVAFALPYSNTWKDLCPGAWPKHELLMLAAWDLVLVLMSCGVTIWGEAQKRRIRSMALLDPADEHRSNASRVATMLVGLQGLRLLMEVSNLLVRAYGYKEGFTPLLLLVNVLEHGQGALLILVLLSQGGMDTHLLRLQELLRHANCGFSAPLELLAEASMGLTDASLTTAASDLGSLQESCPKKFPRLPI